MTRLEFNAGIPYQCSLGEASALHNYHSRTSMKKHCSKSITSTFTFCSDNPQVTRIKVKLFLMTQFRNVLQMCHLIVKRYPSLPRGFSLLFYFLLQWNGKWFFMCKAISFPALDEKHLICFFFYFWRTDTHKDICQTNLSAIEIAYLHPSQCKLDGDENPLLHVWVFVTKLHQAICKENSTSTFPFSFKWRITPSKTQEKCNGKNMKKFDTNLWLKKCVRVQKKNSGNQRDNKR